LCTYPPKLFPTNLSGVGNLIQRAINSYFMKIIQFQRLLAKLKQANAWLKDG